jgi:hypothetical protein
MKRFFLFEFFTKKRVYLGRLLRILQNVIKKILINWRVLQLVKIGTRISGTPVCVTAKQYQLLLKTTFLVLVK